MASFSTTNYQLCQWEPTDQVQRTDFNGDNAKIDTALAELESGKAHRSALNSAVDRIAALENQMEETDDAVQQITTDLTKITFGSYTGNSSSPHTISLGFTPKAVLVFSAWGGTTFFSNSHYQYCGGLALANKPATTQGGSAYLSIVSNGFQLTGMGSTDQDNVLINFNEYTFYYIAFS